MKISAREEALTILEICEEIMDKFGVVLSTTPDVEDPNEEAERIGEAYGEMTDLIRARLELWTAQVKNGADIEDPLPWEDTSWKRKEN